MSNEFKDFGLDADFSSDEEVSEAIKTILSVMRNEIGEKTYPAEVVTERVNQVIFSYKVLEYLMKDSKAKTTYELHKPIGSMGSVSIVGKKIKISDVECFLSIVNIADAFSVDCKTDGTIEMNFTFRGLLRKTDTVI